MERAAARFHAQPPSPSSNTGPVSRRHRSQTVRTRRPPLAAAFFGI